MTEEEHLQRLDRLCDEYEHTLQTLLDTPVERTAFLEFWLHQLRMMSLLTRWMDDTPAGAFVLVRFAAVADRTAREAFEVFEGDQPAGWPALPQLGTTGAEFDGWLDLHYGGCVHTYWREAFEDLVALKKERRAGKVPDPESVRCHWEMLIRLSPRLRVVPVKHLPDLGPLVKRLAAEFREFLIRIE